MLSKGFTLTAKNPDAAKDLQKKADALHLKARFLRAMQWGNLYGGSLLIFGAIDGNADLSKPLNVKRVSDVKFLNVVDRRFCSVVEWQSNPMLEGYGEPEVYGVGNLDGAWTKVHKSRVIAFDGVPETDPLTRRQLGGWTYSVLQRPYDIVRKFATAFDSSAHLMSDASQGVWSIENLIDMLGDNKDELITRLQFSDMTRSAGRAVMVDAASEDFKRVATPLGGVKDILESWMVRLASACDMPITKLFGTAAAGLNATGEGDLRNWYDELASGQENHVKPKMLRALEIIAGGTMPEDLDIEFCSLWEQTAAEKAATEYQVAQTDAIYVTMGAVLPGQVAIARFGSGEGKIEIDEAAMVKDNKNEIDLMLNPPPAPPGLDPNAPPPPPGTKPAIPPAKDPNAPKPPAPSK
jgi:phage-related protein (TIGR01555 family)